MSEATDYAPFDAACRLVLCIAKPREYLPNPHSTKIRSKLQVAELMLTSYNSTATLLYQIYTAVSTVPKVAGSCTISWVKLERQAVEVEEGGSEEEGQGPKAEGKAKEGTPPWGRRAKDKQRRRDLWYDESC